MSCICNKECSFMPSNKQTTRQKAIDPSPPSPFLPLRLHCSKLAIRSPLAVSSQFAPSSLYSPNLPSLAVHNVQCSLRSPRRNQLTLLINPCSLCFIFPIIARLFLFLYISSNYTYLNKSAPSFMPLVSFLTRSPSYCYSCIFCSSLLHLLN